MLDYFTQAHISTHAAQVSVAQNEARSFRLFQALRALRRPGLKISTWWSAAKTERERRRAVLATERALNQLSEQQLSDIGVIRAEIRYLAEASSHAPGRFASELRHQWHTDGAITTPTAKEEPDVTAPEPQIEPRAKPLRRALRTARTELQRAAERKRQARVRNQGLTPREASAMCCG